METNCAAVNALNVFPVPDGDTGTNMLLTLRTASREASGAMVEEGDDADAGFAAEALARGALLGARGNSGVILSQYLRGLAGGVAGVKVLAAADLAHALTEAAAAAYGAMSNPVEGTVLTVARDAALAAETAAGLPDATFRRTFIAAAAAAEDSVMRTPDLLPLLREAGVVDSGGQGLALILRGAASAFAGVDPGPALVAGGALEIDATWLRQQTGVEWGFCTEFVLFDPTVSTADFRATMSRFGDSESIVEGVGLIRVHIHTGMPEEALAEAESSGRLEQVSIRNMDQQHAQFIAEQTAGVDAPACGVVAVAAGVGFVRVMRSLGAAAIIWGGQSMNPSAEEIAEAADSLPMSDVVILPNNKNIVPTAELARSLSPKSLRVVPTLSLPQGIAALLAHNPYQDARANAARMIEASDGVSWGEVTVAVRRGSLGEVSYDVGQSIALLGGDLIAAADSRDAALLQLVVAMAPGVGSLLTLYRGAGVSQDEADAAASAARSRHEGLDVEVVDGGQPLYPYVVSLE